VGDTVNVASRLEGLNTQLGTDLLVSQSTFQMTHEAGFGYRPLGLANVKGRVEPIQIYQLLGRAGAAVADALPLPPAAATLPGPTAAPEAERVSTRSASDATGSFHPTLARYEIIRLVGQ